MPDLEDDSALRSVVTSTWPDVDLSKLTAKDLCGKVALNEFMETHCRVRQYAFQVGCCCRAVFW